MSAQGHVPVTAGQLFLRPDVACIQAADLLVAMRCLPPLLLLRPAGCSMEEVVEAAMAANAHNFISSLPKG